MFYSFCRVLKTRTGCLRANTVHSLPWWERTCAGILSPSTAHPVCLCGTHTHGSVCVCVWGGWVDVCLYLLPANKYHARHSINCCFFVCLFRNVSNFCPDLGGLHREHEAALPALYFTEGWSKNHAGTKHNLINSAESWQYKLLHNIYNKALGCNTQDQCFQWIL